MVTDMWHFCRCTVGAEVETAGGAGDVSVRVWTCPGVSASGAGLWRSHPACQCGGQRRHDLSGRRRCFQSRTEQRRIPIVLRTRKVSCRHRIHGCGPSVCPWLQAYAQFAI